MPTIESVSIEGFWGNHDVFLRFHPEVNFLVGVNGSGKTTAIDILASALQCDEEALERLPFRKIEIVLFDKETRRKPSVLVERNGGDEGGYPSIIYKIKASATSKPEQMHVFSPYDIRERHIGAARSMHFDFNSRKMSSISGNKKFLKSFIIHRDVRGELSTLIKMNWLSINRVSSVRSSSERGQNETHVDRKLREISERLERYFSELSSNANQRTRDFQQKLFRSLISGDTTFSLAGKLEGMNLHDEKLALIDIFNRFGIPKDEYLSDAEKFFDTLRVIQDSGDKSSYTVGEIVNMINAHKIHSLVDEWNKAVSLEKKTLQPRDAFIKILDSMLHRKVAKVLPSGEMIFHSRSGKELRVWELSSGEKQLFIILGEALLQKDAEWTYIADEPELSLHVDWQEVLVDNLRALNPNSQVIFATHSPDIISHYSNYVIDMETAIK
ncbi:AAA family ATPase [Tistrella mobilis]